MNMPPIGVNNVVQGAVQAPPESRQGQAPAADTFKPGETMPSGNMPSGGVQAPGTGAAPAAPVPAAPANSAQVAQQIEALLGQIMSNPEAEAEMLQMLASLNASGQLKPALYMVAAKASEAGQLPPMPIEKRNAMVEQLSGMIDAELGSHGMTPSTAGKAYQSWEALGQEHYAKIQNTRVAPRRPGELSSFTDPEFVRELEALQGAPFRQGNRVSPLINGPASFAERDRLIDGATKSIHMMTWAFYDDETGWETARKLAAKHQQGLDVQVVVDGQLAERAGHTETVKFMEEQGIKVVRWRDPEHPYNGQHRKEMIVDGKAVIAGGLNAGNVYSHKGPADGQKWRDTDVLMEGPAVADCERLFADLCGRDENPAVPAAVDNARTAVVNHAPGSDSHIMLATMKAIQGASETIDIENAYFIQTPGLKKVLMDALERGIQVRILTNSAESVDEQIVTAPILASLPDLVAAGAEVYTKKGDTLHSKFMVVDGMYTSLGSYNLHPRSERYEGEMTINTLDTKTAQSLTQAFENDIAQAAHIERPEQIVVPDNTLTKIVSRYFFDQV